MASKAQIINEANNIEAFAKDSLKAWCILGTTYKYDEHMQVVAKLRRAAEMKVAERNEYMKHNNLK